MGGSDESTERSFIPLYGSISFVILCIISAEASYIFEAAVAIVNTELMA